MQGLVDTGVLLRLPDSSDPHHADIRQALQRLRARGDVARQLCADAAGGLPRAASPRELEDTPG